MDTDADDKQRLADALARLTPEQTARYQKQDQLWKANGDEPSGRLRTEVAHTIAKGMPERETRDEIKDKEKRAELGFDNFVPIKDRPPGAQTLEEILAQAERDVQAEKDLQKEWQRSAQQTLGRDGR